MNKDTVLKKTVNEELAILNGVIDYAEKMISDNRWVTDCTILRRRAYAKTVVIETEQKGRCIYRLTTASITDKLSSGCATPYSPIGRLCSVANVGFDGESAMLGEYEITETRLFDRFDGVNQLNNLRNFLQMKIETETDSIVVSDLKKFVEPQKVISKPPARKEEMVIEKIALELPKFETPLFIVDDEEDDSDDISKREFDEGIEYFYNESADVYFGLNEVFYVNQTIQQNKIIARAPFGAMYVEGVAGSGKTSAALGRTKMLCGFNAENVWDKTSFEDILGEDFGDYWEGKYADKFSQDGSIGFVRTAELIQYLKETCRRIDLPNLPIDEYKELQNSLIHRHQITLTQLDGGRWKKGANRESYAETSMCWFYTTDQNIANFLSENLRRSLSSAEFIANHFVANKNFAMILNVIKKALVHFEVEFSRIEKELAAPNQNQKFLLDGLAEKINKAIKSTSDEILGQNTFWFFYEDTVLHSKTLYGMAELLAENHISFFKKSGLKSEFSNVEDLYIQLLDGSIEKLYLLYGENTLRRLTLHKGFGSLRLPVQWLYQIKNRVLNNSELLKLKPTSNKAKETSIRSFFTTALEKTLINNLYYVADIYYLALDKSQSDYPDLNLAVKILTQLKTKKFTTQDIDLVLCLSHLICRNFSGSRTKPEFYQSVFIDEVQDFTEQQIYLMAEQADPQYKAVTIVGDIAQKLHNGHTIDIRSCFPSGTIPLIQLTDNLRQLESPALALFSHIFRNYFQGEDIIISPQLSKTIQTAKALVLPEIYLLKNTKELDKKIVELVTNSAERQTLAVIMPDNVWAKKIHGRVKEKLSEDLIDSRFSENSVDLSQRFIKHFISVLNAKGLEFDTVILPYLEEYNLKNQSDINKLYVGLTRAKKRLIMIGTKENQLFSDVWSRFGSSLNEIEHFNNSTETQAKLSADLKIL